MKRITKPSFSYEKKWQKGHAARVREREIKGFRPLNNGSKTREQQ